MTTVLALLMLVQALLGLLLPGHYRDAAWIRAAWWGDDWFTLLAAVPLLGAGSRAAARGSARGTLLVLGIAGYAIYDYLFYLFGAALNSFFPLYVANVLAAGLTLVSTLSRLTAASGAPALSPEAPARTIGAYLAFVGSGLAVVWFGFWPAFAFAGRPTPIEPEAFKVVAALDLGLMVPALWAGGVLLRRRHRWGLVMAAIAAIQGAMYLLVLSLNSTIAIRRGPAAAPGELPIWGPLAVFTSLAAIVLLRNGPVSPAARARG